MLTNDTDTSTTEDLQTQDQSDASTGVLDSLATETVNDGEPALETPQDTGQDNALQQKVDELEADLTRLRASHKTLQSKYNSETRNQDSDIEGYRRRISELEATLAAVNSGKKQNEEMTFEQLQKELGLSREEAEALGYENLSTQRKIIQSALKKLKPTEEPAAQTTDKRTPKERMFTDVMNTQSPDWATIDKRQDFASWLDQNPINRAAYLNSYSDGLPEVAMEIQGAFLASIGEAKTVKATTKKFDPELHVQPKTMPAKTNEPEIISKAEFDRVVKEFINAGVAVPKSLSDRYKAYQVAKREGRVRD